MPSITSAPHNADSLEKVAGRLNSIVLRLQAAVEVLREMKLDQVEITRQADLISGLHKIENWAHAVHQCIHRRLEDDGTYQAPSSAVSTPKKRR